MFVELSSILPFLLIPTLAILFIWTISLLVLLTSYSIKKINIDDLIRYLEHSELNQFNNTILSLGNNGYIAPHFTEILISKYYISSRNGRNIIIFRWTKAHQLIENRYKELRRNR